VKISEKSAFHWFTALVNNYRTMHGTYNIKTNAKFPQFRAAVLQLLHENKRKKAAKLIVIYMKLFVVNVVIIYKKVYHITVACVDGVHKNILCLRTKSK
jgi:hypothetical protein